MSSWARITILSLGAVVLLAAAAPAAAAGCQVSTTKRKFEGAERTIITMENERIRVEVVPDLGGRIITYQDKQRPGSPFEWLDDCPYHYGARWEGKPFTHRIVETGPQRGVVTVSGGGKIAVAMMRYVTGNDVASPVELKVDRTMTIEADSTRLQIAVTFTNVGDGVAPKFRNMVHAVYGNIPPMPQGRAFWFLPTATGLEFFDPTRGNNDMGQAAGGAPVDHPFSRFTPGLKADKPRYESGGWGAVLTSQGPTYIFYEATKYDFIQYWFGGDSTWHFTFEPHSKAVDLKPGEATTNVYTLAYDSRDVPFTGTTVAYERPQLPDVLTPGDPLQLKARATTVQTKNEPVKVTFSVTRGKGEKVLTEVIEGAVKPFVFTDLAVDTKLPETVATGVCSWEMLRADGQAVATGKFEVVTAQELAKRKMEKATADLRKELEETRQRLNDVSREFRQVSDLWRSDANMALGFADRTVWPVGVPASAVSVTIQENAVPVLGLWKTREVPRLKALAGMVAGALPGNADALLAPLKDERALIRDLAPTPDRQGLVVLLCDPAKQRTQIVRLTAAGVGPRFGRFAEKPGESDDALGGNCRGLVVDADGSVWVGTNAWGQTSVFRRGADGAPFEDTVIGDKGALKKFSPEGRLLGAISLLTAPLDLVPAVADGTPAIVATYRHVSAYHGAQVREGALVVAVGTVKSLGELKLPGGSLAVDDAGRVWAADVAGHVACYTISGKKLLDVKDSPEVAVPDAVLPVSSPLPMVLRPGPQGTVWALAVMRRQLLRLNPDGTSTMQPVPETTGNAVKLVAGAAGTVLVVADRALWSPGQ